MAAFVQQLADGGGSTTYTSSGVTTTTDVESTVTNASKGGNVVYITPSSSQVGCEATVMNTDYGPDDNGNSISDNTTLNGLNSSATYGKYRLPSGSTSTNSYYKTFAKAMNVPASETSSTSSLTYEGTTYTVNDVGSSDYFFENTDTNTGGSYSWRRYRYLMQRGKLPWNDETFTGGYDDGLDDGNVTSSSHSIYAEQSRLSQDTRQAIIHGVGLYEANSYQNLLRNIRNYNRYKLPVPDAMLQRSFAHVFFVKPQCNIVTYASTQSANSRDMRLSSSVRNNTDFLYAYYHAPMLLLELSPVNPYRETDLSFLLSNSVTSFSLSDESLETDTYGKSLTGYQIAYGKHDVASRSAGEFTISFQDDKDLHVYQLLKLWTAYISGCYQGTIVPKLSTITDHILDYAGAVYYILTAEDGETILFWSKYYGVFPVNSPSSMFGWSYGNLLSCPKYDVSFKYSMKKDLDPYSLVELNGNSRVSEFNGDLRYMSNYDPDTLGPGETWVGIPYIESYNDGFGLLQYKLRFTKPTGESNNVKSLSDVNYRSKASFTDNSSDDE